MSIKSGNGIVQIWNIPLKVNNREIPDFELTPLHQLDPIKINLSPTTHEVKTDDSDTVDRRYNKGFNCTITITLADISLDVIRGFLPGENFQ